MWGKTLSAGDVALRQKSLNLTMIGCRGQIILEPSLRRRHHTRLRYADVLCPEPYCECWFIFSSVWTWIQTMLLNTWLSAAKRHFLSTATTRRLAATGSRRVRTEELENRALLTALVVNADNQSLFTTGSGGISINNSHMVGKDSLVIEGINIAASSGNAITVNLSGMTLNSLAIESIFVSNYTVTGFDIDLTNISGLHTIAIEDVSITSPTNGRGIDLTLSNTDADAVTIDDSVIPGIRLDAVNGSLIDNGLITENRINAGAGFEGIVLNVNGAAADNFRILNNTQITTLNRDSIQINATNNAIDGLAITNNVIGAAEGANVLFRADGDTFVQPFVLTNNATQGERLQTFVFDVSGLGLEFDIDPVTGKPFTPIGNTGVLTGFTGATLSANKQVLTATFTDFAPGETLRFLVDIDIAGGVPASIFGDDLIGADVNINFSGNKSVAGQMAGDPASIAASQFIVGPGAAGANSGINLNLTNSPVTNATITNNRVVGAPGFGLLIDAQGFSDVSAVVTGNQFSSSGRDGIRLDMTDSNFFGAIIGNNVANNGGHGISILPVSSRSGLVQQVFDGNPVVITSANHGLQTGEQIMIQGMVNLDLSIAHPANGLRTIERIDPNRFRLLGVDGTGANVNYSGGGAWYVPNIQPDGSARGLVQIDMQSTVPRGTIRAATNAGPIEITSPGHGLVTGQRVRISNVQGNTNANGVQKVTVIDADRFTLDGSTGNGAYDTTTGFGSWTGNVVTNATNVAGIVVTSPGHGLQTGEEIRVTGVLGNTAANGTFRVTVLNADSFRLDGSAGNGVYGGGGQWVSLRDTTFTGDRIPQRIGQNTITGNTMTGIYVDLKTGTQFNADIVANNISSNTQKGIHIASHSFGLGTDLPLDPADNLALPGLQDLGFDVNIGTSAAGDGNVLSQNTQAGIVIEALDYGTGSFEIRQNTISSTRDDGNAATMFQGDGIVIRMDNQDVAADAVSLLSRSVIDGNTIGVDNLGNDGHGLFFALRERSRIQDLQVTNNTFLNNDLDGFHFERTEDADLNQVIFEKNRATNNGGDGFSLLAHNTVKDRLDFQINENVITDNGQYGLRIDVQAAARLSVQFDRNSVLRNGHNPAGQGYHPNDGVPGSANRAGGIGIFAFLQVDVIITADNSHIDSNIGDGFSVDAFKFLDALKLTTTFTNTTFNSNTLTGFRSHGTAFGAFDWRNSEFNFNGEDGVRIVSIDDKNDPFRRRVGGSDIDLIAMNTQFVQNVQSGLMLGQGTSAKLGDGSIGNANYFDGNGEDGLKIVQSSGAHLELLDRRRHIQSNRNFFRNNQGDGIDIGHFTKDEALTQIGFINGILNGNVADGEDGNLQHGEEVVTDTFITIADAVISSNGGDGVEFLGDSISAIPPRTGGGQDVAYDYNSGLTIRNSRIVNNGKRGIDVLNRVQHDVYVSLIGNQILSNGYEGVYVMNTASHFQRQNGPNDPLDIYLEVFRNGQTAINPNIELRVQNNLIQSNGTSSVTSTVPINESNSANDTSISPHPDHTHRYTQQTGTLGGLVIRVGTAEGGFNRAADPAYELGLSGIDAEVVDNRFDGNFGADVYFDNFVSQIMWQMGDVFDVGDPRFRWIYGYRDPLARLDLVFRNNTGNSLDVINGFAFYDNWEGVFKSRQVSIANVPNPTGHFDRGWETRKRNGTRTTGFQFFNDITTDPANWSHDFIHNTDPAVFVVTWSYDGLGTSSWRIESDFVNSNTFGQTNSTLGYSDFFDVINLGFEGEGEMPYQWDTGVDTPSFNGNTSFSLDRGDVFNVRPGEAPIAPDSLEDNDSFVGAYNLGTVSGGGFNVNSLATGSNLNIDLKADRDYYSFTAGGSGPLAVNLGATDLLGDFLTFMVYEVNHNSGSEEQALLIRPDGTPNYSVVPVGGSRTMNVNVVSGKTYIIEIFSDEFENWGDDGAVGKPFRYGTARNYSLTIDAPALGAGNGASGNSQTADASGFAADSSGGDSQSGAGNSGGDGGTASGSLPGGPTASFVAVSPDPRSTAVSTVTVNFNEDVTGVDLADFSLRRGGVTIPLTAVAGASVTQISPMQYTLNLGNFTGEAGSYVLTLTAAGSGIRDTDNVALQANVTESWSVTNSVNVFTDSRDTVVGDGQALDLSGSFSLRAGVMEGNSSPGAHVIQLAAGTYTLSLAGRFEDAAATGDLDIRGNITIRGVSARDSIIDAADLDRVFHVFPGAVLTLENLTIRNGQAFDGGAIFNEGSVILRGVNIAGNEAFSQGGGIYNLGTINSLNSSISLNAAGSRGGAVHNRGTADFVNTTISTNTAVSRGGGIFNEGTAVSRMTNVTVANNSAGSRAGGIGTESTGSASLGNTIVAQNTTDPSSVALGSKNQDILGTVVSNGFNLVSILDSSFATPASAGLVTSDLFGRTDTPLATGIGALSSSAGNGTWQHPLQAGSIAVDNGNNALFPAASLLASFDQIGNPRLIEADLDGTVTIDIGAIEMFVSQPVAIGVATPDYAGIGQTITFDGSRSTHTNPSVRRIVSWRWDLDNNGSFESTGVSVTGSFNTNGTKTVVLQVTDDTGVTDTDTLTVIVGVPNAPVVNRPFSVTTDLTPTISWESGIKNYDLVIDKLAFAGAPAINNYITRTGLTANSFTPPTNLPVGQYRVTVIAKNSSGQTPSVPYVFEVRRINQTAPVGNVFDTTPRFTWDSIPGTSRYDIWVDQTLPSISRQVVRNEFVSNASFEPSSSLGPGTFTWWVRAYDADGNVGDWSVGKTFSIVKPTVLTPGAATLDSTPTITWSSVGAPRYELWVDQVGGTNRIIHQTALTTTSFTPATALPNGTYRVWVRGLALDGESGLWSDVRTFQMDFRVGPITITPVGITTDTTPTFSWQAVEGVASYDLWVDDVTGGKSQVIRVQNIPHVNGASTISWTSPGILNPGQYRWWVRSNSVEGPKSGWSAATNFTVPVPAMTAPVGIVTGTNRPTFQWTGVAQYVSYQLWVDNLTTGTTQVINVSGITGTQYTPDLPLENGNFRAWVRGTDAAGNRSNWSAPLNFTMNAGVSGAPTAVSPRISTGNNRPTFTWTPAANATTYQLIVTQLTASGQPTVINVSNIPGTVVNSVVSYTTTTSLTPGQTYRWWVRGISSNGVAGAWSQPVDFRVTSTDDSQPLLPFDSDGEVQLIPVVATFNAQYEYADDVISIAAHPAGTVVQMNPERMLEAPAGANTVEIQGNADESSAVEIDTVMQMWADGELSEVPESQSSVPAAAAMPELASSSTQAKTSVAEAGATSFLTGLLAMATGRPVRRRKERE